MKQQETEPTGIETAQPGAALPASAQRDDREQAGKWAVLGIVAIGVFMATLDSSIVNISLPSIAKYFRVPLNGAVSWIIIAYLLSLIHISEPTRLGMISYAVFCLKKK